MHAGRGKVVVDDESRSRLSGSDPGDAGEERVGWEGGFESCSEEGPERTKEELSSGLKEEIRREQHEKTYELRLRHLGKVKGEGSSQ